MTRLTLLWSPLPPSDAAQDARQWHGAAQERGAWWRVLLCEIRQLWKDLRG